MLDNVQLDANAYVIKMKEVEAGSGKVWAGQYMVMDPAGGQVKLPGTHTTEPTFGLPATWIDGALKEEATMKGYTVVDAATVLSTHLTELLKSNMAELLSYGEVQKLLKELPKEQADLVKDLVPNLITVSGIQRVLQILLAERVSIRDLATILEGIADGIAGSRNPVNCRTRARAAVAPACAQHTSHSGYLPLIALSAKWEQAFAESMVGQGDERQLAMQPSRLSEFITLGARALRGSSARRRSARAGDIVEYPAIRARHCRTVPCTDPGALAKRDPSARAPEDGQQHLAGIARAANRRQRTERARGIKWP